MRTIAIVALLAVTLGACAPVTTAVPTGAPTTGTFPSPTAMPSPRAANFSISWKYYPCGGNSHFLAEVAEPDYPPPMYFVDTARGILSYTPIGEADSIVIPFRLADAEAEAIYQEGVRIGFFDYPSAFEVPEPFVRGLVMPAQAYTLRLTNGSLSTSVIWSDHAIVEPAYAPADRLRELMVLIRKTVQAHPEVQELPPGKLCL